jgi:aconitate hydratase
VRQLADWKPDAPRIHEIPFIVSRIILQDFTGMPLLCDLATMRGVAFRMGKDPAIIEPMVPVGLVIDHSVQIDYYGESDALQKNMEAEFKRNRERYQFLKWGMNAFRTLKSYRPVLVSCTRSILSILPEACTKKKASFILIPLSALTVIPR